MGGVLSKYGETPGAPVLTEIIAPVIVQLEDGAWITDFGATVSDGATASEVILQLSRDGFITDIRAKSTIVITKSGTVFKSFTSSIRVEAGEAFRVVVIQGVPSKVTAELFGKTLVNDITD